MSGYLKLKLDIEDDGLGKLFLEFSINGFSGRGSACLELKEISSKASNFGAYPLAFGPELRLVGGRWDLSNPAHLIQEHLSVSVRAEGMLGDLKLKLYVAEPSLDTNSLDPIRSAQAEIKTTYEQLRELSNGLYALVSGELDELVLSELPA